MTQKKRAVVLLSGGIDSSTCLALASSEGYDCYAMSVRYGQRNVLELEAARRVADSLSVSRHLVVDLSMNWITGSALTADIEVPRGTEGQVASPVGEVPVTYVPARNTIFLGLGAAWAEDLETDHLFIGVNQVDYSGYPDCRPRFIESMQRTIQLGTKRTDFNIHTPLVDLTKAQIIRTGVELGLDYALTWSCYAPRGGRACGQCDSCVQRRKGFREAGASDPTLYSNDG